MTDNRPWFGKMVAGVRALFGGRYGAVIPLLLAATLLMVPMFSTPAWACTPPNKPTSVPPGPDPGCDPCNGKTAASSGGKVQGCTKNPIIYWQGSVYESVTDLSLPGVLARSSSGIF
ncbi:MAG: hypothetical protein ACE15C_20925 [Phycisphaerae bacterium]